MKSFHATKVQILIYFRVPSFPKKMTSFLKYCFCQINIVPLHYKPKDVRPVISEKDLLSEYKTQDFIRKFDDVLRVSTQQGVAFKTTELCKLVAGQPAPRFYVTAKVALYQYNMYKSGRSILRRVEKRKMYAEIFSRFEKIMQISGGNICKVSAMEMVVKQEAPCFYLTDSSAISIYYKAMNKKRQKARA